MSFLFQVAAHYAAFLRFVIHAGIVWGIRFDSPAEWRAAVEASPLRFEFAKLDANSKRLTGRPIFGLAGTVNGESPDSRESEEKAD